MWVDSLICVSLGFLVVKKFKTEKSGAVSYYAVQLIGVCGSSGVWGTLHLLGEVARAIQGVCRGPLEKSFLSIKEN